MLGRLRSEGGCRRVVRGCKALGAVGGVLAAMAVVWAWVVPSRLVVFPAHLDWTVHAAGTLTLHVLPPALAPPRPVRLPLTVDRHIRTLSVTASTAVVEDTSVQRAAVLPALSVRQVYTLDRRRLVNVADGRARQYGRALPTAGRAGAYSVGVPAGSAPPTWKLWKNETGAPYELRRVGETTQFGGVRLLVYEGRVDSAPVTPGYRAELVAEGLPDGSPVAAVPQVRRAVAALRRLPGIVPPSTVVWRYALAGDTRALVEPRSGSVVGVTRLEHRVTVTPDPEQLAGLVAGVRRYLGSPAGRAASAALVRVGSLPPQHVLDLSYTTSPADITAAARAAGDLGAEAELVTFGVPAGAMLAAVLVLAAAAAVQMRATRRVQAAAGVLVPAVRREPTVASQQLVRER